VSQRSSPLKVKISGKMALFTRPEMKVERVSYDIITPSAARGVLEAVLWKPEMRWVIERITVLNPIRFLSVKRNEVANKIPSTFRTWAREGGGVRPFYADDDRQQRSSVMLRDVAYVVEAAIELSPRAAPGESVVKYVEMFSRRVANGQHFQQPYLGCRELPAEVEPVGADDRPHKELLGREADLGWMLNDIEYRDGKPVRPHFFRARMVDGVVEVPPLPTEVPA
jgi:CRISPR-associated protein Cas5d